MSTYLGIDYGTAHIGISLSEGSLSSPLTSLNNNKSLTGQLVKLVETHNITTIVIGLPDGPLANEVKIFAKEVGTVTSKEVHLHPETLSTHEAITALRSTGAKRQKLQNEHAYAACLILDDYLELTAKS